MPYVHENEFSESSEKASPGFSLLNVFQETQLFTRHGAAFANNSSSGMVFVRLTIKNVSS